MPPEIDRETILHVAALARLRVDDDDLARLTEQMGQILAFAEQLDELDLVGVPPTARVTGEGRPLRSDDTLPGLPHEAALANAPETAGPFFRVSKVIDGGGES